MRIDDGMGWRTNRALEDDGDLALADRAADEPAAAPEPAPAAAPAPAADPPGQSLRDLPPPDVAAPPAPAVAAAPAPTAVAAPALAAPATYVGEPPVDAAWLASREAALKAVRADYEAAAAAARAQVGGPGWRVAQTYTDESGQTLSASGLPLTFVADPNAAPVVVAYDESGPVYGQPGGTWYEFDDAAFAAQYQAQAGAPLQTLAGLYGTDAATLLAQHPELWGIATGDHALNAGPPPAGRAMGDPSQLGMLDLYLADPQVRQLIDTYGGTPAPAASGIAQEQVRIYGAQRYAELTRLGNAMQSVRDQYAQAMAQAQASGGPGTIDRPRTITVSDESGPARQMTLTDESGQPLMERVFDPDAFTAWYEQQPGLANQSFAQFYGASHTTFATDESGASYASTITFDNPNWSMYGAGGGMARRDLAQIDPNHPPELNDNSAIGFDLEAGWATPQGNIHQDRDWFETVFQIAIVGIVTYVSAGTLGPAVAGAVGGGAVGAVAGAAAVGAVSAAVSGALSGNLTLKGVLQGALAGGLTAGLTQALNVVIPAGPVGTVAIRTTVQGGVQALLGGKFEDGAIAGFASGLAEVAGTNMQQGIDDAVKAGTMDATQAVAARQFARMVGSAIRAAGNPNDPSYGFASAFLNDVIQQAGDAAQAQQPTTPVVPPAFDDDGNLMPGVVDPNATPAEQQAQLATHLESQGIDAETAQQLAGEAVARSLPDLMPRMLAALNDPRTAADRLITDTAQDQALDEVNAELGINPEADPNIVPAGWLGDAANSASNYVSRLVERTGGPLRDMMGRAMNAITIDQLEDAKASIASYLDGVAARGGLSEVEIMALGVLYAANEALFPTTVLDLIPGGGKALGKVGELVRLGSSARELASATRLESRAMAESERAIGVSAAGIEARAAAEGREVIRQQRGQTGDWNAALNGPLKPNAVYVLDNGHSYFTDAAGRVTRAEGTLDLGKMDRNTYQQVVAGQIGGEGYDGGHLIASLFGGAGEKINLVPQLASVNRGEFRAMEKGWADALNAGKSVKVEVTPIYGAEGGVPTEIVARWWIDGVPSQRSFPNISGG